MTKQKINVHILNKTIDKKNSADYFDNFITLLAYFLSDHALKNVFCLAFLSKNEVHIFFAKSKVRRLYQFCQSTLINL